MIGEIKSNMYNEKIVPILNDLENKDEDKMRIQLDGKDRIYKIEVIM